MMNSARSVRLKLASPGRSICTGATGLVVALIALFALAGCAATSADGKPKPKMRTVCMQQESASGSRLSRRVCRQVEVKPAAEAGADEAVATDAEAEPGR